jgi:subfamily B ATP-binding cassette protein MsbA
MSRLTTGALLRPHALRLVGGVLCLAVAGACEALYAYLTGPLIQLIWSGGREGAAAFSLPGVSAIGAPSLVAVAIAIVAVALVKGSAQLAGSLLHEGSAERLGFALRLLVYRQLMRLPLATHRRHAAGELLQRLIDDVRRVQEAAIASSYVLGRDVVAVLALCAVAVAMVPGLALAAAAILPVAAGLTALLGRGVKRSARAGQDALGRLAARAMLGLDAIREVKSAGAEVREVEAVARSGREVLAAALRQLRLRTAAPFANELLAALALGGTLIYAGGRVADGALAPERFVSFFTALLLAYRPLRELARAHSQRRSAAASLERIRSLLDEPAEPEGEATAAVLSPLRRALSLRGVSFSYPGAAVAAISSVDLTLAPGRVLALGGPSGAGKSTLANLVCGLERPGAGTIWWDDVVIDESVPLAALRREVALVPQQPLLLDGTLAENLRYAAPGAGDAELADALRQSGLEEVVARLPRGLDSALGPGGAGLSVGEIQRVGLARAILKRASVLVLDEPTSALDAAREAALCETIRTLAASRAVLLIAHDPAPLAIADEVLSLDGRRGLV